MSSEAVDLRDSVEAVTIPFFWHLTGCELTVGNERTVRMTKTNDNISEIIRNPKHPFRKADDRPVKAQKHRYERRKIKEFIRLGDWSQEGLG